jgi:hypothetical protein
VVSLGLPLGISSLKLTGNGRKKKREGGGAASRAVTLYKYGKNNRCNNNSNNVDSGHFSDGELLSRERGHGRHQQQNQHQPQQQYVSDVRLHHQLQHSWHQEPARYHENNSKQQQGDMAVVINRNLRAGRIPDNNTEGGAKSRGSSPPAARKSSLPRKAKIPSSYLWRPLSVDAELLLESADKSAQLAGSQTTMMLVSSEDSGLRYAQLTSTKEFMAAQTVVEGAASLERSSSGNSSGCDLSSAVNTTTSCSSSSSSSFSSEDSCPVAEDRTDGSNNTAAGAEAERCQHPAVRSRRSQVGTLPANRGPPPRHLLPQRLRPSPGRKLHPVVILPPQIRKGRLRTLDITVSEKQNHFLGFHIVYSALYKIIPLTFILFFKL